MQKIKIKDMITNVVGHNKLCHSYYYMLRSAKKKKCFFLSLRKWSLEYKYRDQHNIAVYIASYGSFWLWNCFSIKILNYGRMLSDAQPISFIST